VLQILILDVLDLVLPLAARDSYGLSEQGGWQWGITLAGVLCLSGVTLWRWIRPDEKSAG
jgi:hypothetical protein